MGPPYPVPPHCAYALFKQGVGDGVTVVVVFVVSDVVSDVAFDDDPEFERLAETFEVVGLVLEEVEEAGVVPVEGDDPFDTDNDEEKLDDADVANDVIEVTGRTHWE